MRKSGVLMHISSIPSKETIGNFGGETYRFVEFLHSAGQKLWQVLPLGHIGFGNSPYQAYSAFAGNPYLIDLKCFDQVEYIAEINDKTVNYPSIITEKIEMLKKCLEKQPIKSEEYFEFCKVNSFWLEDYALFMVLKDQFEGLPWYKWPYEYKSREPDAMKEYRKRNNHALELYRMMQYLFHIQWHNLKIYANVREIAIIGDIPLYVSHDSADVWSQPELFLLDDDENPTFIAGVPPDYFSAVGQVWDNPIYNWEKHKETNFDWWIKRFEQNYSLFDYVRLDHFRGLESFWAIPYGEANAIQGTWMEAPGEELLAIVTEKFQGHRLIAEDLGSITNEVEALRDKFNLPGMKVLQFAFSAHEDSAYLPHNHIRNCVVYTGTHDNNTIEGWFADESHSQDDREFAMDYLQADKSNIVTAMITAAFDSTARFTIIPMQDWLGLDAESRMNHPGTIIGNWEWRMKKDALTEELADRMRKMTRIYRR